MQFRRCLDRLPAAFAVLALCWNDAVFVRAHLEVPDDGGADSIVSSTIGTSDPHASKLASISEAIPSLENVEGAEGEELIEPNSHLPDPTLVEEGIFSESVEENLVPPPAMHDEHEAISMERRTADTPQTLHSEKCAQIHQATAATCRIDPTKFSYLGDNADDEFEDERTLLDVFGEVAKDYLTTKVIPKTDSECRWDWRSTRCEPHCDCKLRTKWGDYHLGRSCRRREVDELQQCEAVPPEERWKRQPATRRLVSLVTQTTDIVRSKAKRTSSKAKQRVSNKIRVWQDKTCGELWRLQKQHQMSVLSCLLPHEVPQINWRQQVACGPVELRICDQQQASPSRQALRSF